MPHRSDGTTNLPDDTVLLRRPASPRLPGWLGVLVVLALLLAGSGFTWVHWSTSTGPAQRLPVATSTGIGTHDVFAPLAQRFAPNPDILVLNFLTLSEQGRALNRLAAWAEKAGMPRNRLLSDEELDAAIRAVGLTSDTFFYGHDYRAADIAGFFALADRDGIELNAEERALRRLVARVGTEPAGFGALIAVPRASAANGVDAESHATILRHELSHGEYFTNPAYAAFVDTVWHSMLTEAERAAFRTYLAAEGYDPAMEGLMMNEMQAYLMHTPDPRFFDASKLGISAARLAQLRRGFVAGMPPGWLRNATPHP